MKKLFTNILCLFVLGFSVKLKAQVLFEENFNSYPVGHLINDYTSTTPQQGGWLSGVTPPVTGSAMVTQEAGKGNVLIITSNGVSPIGGTTLRQSQGVIDGLWNNRATGNNILKFEYEIYGIDVFNALCSVMSQSNNLITTGFLSSIKRINGSYWDMTFVNTIVLKNYNTDPFPFNIWIKVEMFMDYNTNNVYFYIPTLNLQKSDSFPHNRMPENVYFTISSLNSSSIIKLDNIKISALQTLPSYILSTNEQLAAKFNLYPNPATNVVNITQQRKHVGTTCCNL